MDMHTIVYNIIPKYQMFSLYYYFFPPGFLFKINDMWGEIRLDLYISFQALMCLFSDR